MDILIVNFKIWDKRDRHTFPANSDWFIYTRIICTCIGKLYKLIYNCYIQKELIWLVGAITYQNFNFNSWTLFNLASYMNLNVKMNEGNL